MTEEHIQENIKTQPRHGHGAEMQSELGIAAIDKAMWRGISKVLPILKDISLLPETSSEPSDLPLWDHS